jgi:hypothetical protein
MIMEQVQSGENGISRDKPECDEFTRLIVKLRWIGLDDEAERLQRVVRGFAPEVRASALAAPICTD